MIGHHSREIIIDPDDFLNIPAFSLRVFSNLLRQERQFPRLFEAASDALSMVAVKHDLDPIIETLSGPAFPSEDPQPAGCCLDTHTRGGRPVSLLLDWQEFNLEGALAAIDSLLDSGGYCDRTVVFARNAGIAAGVLGLDEIEEVILGLAVTLENNRHACSIYDRVFARTTNLVDTIAALLNIERTEIKARLSASAPLIRNGILRIDSNFENILRPDPLAVLDEALAGDLDGADELVQRLLGTPEETDLEVDDFQHLEGEYTTLRSLLLNAVATGERGVNVLFYGRPGTGKTEFSRLLANAIGMPLYATGKADNVGGEPMRNERLDAYLMFQRLMAESNRAGLCLVDEADDIFGTPNPFSRRAPGSKLFTNRMFETNVVPTIWIVNDPDELPASIRRRMSYALHVDLPPAPLTDDNRQWQHSTTATHIY